MSIAIMTEVWKDAPVSGTELLMLLALADSCNDDRECWPSVRHLMHKVRLSEPQARRVLKSLERQGLIEIDVKQGKGAKGRESNRYRVCALSPIADDTSTPIAHDTTTGIADDTLNHHKEPSIETSVEIPPNPRKRGATKQPAESPQETEAVNAIIGMYLGTQQIIAPKTYRNKSNRSDATFMHSKGVTPELVRAYILTTRAAPFWKDKVISWRKFAAEILTFKQHYVAPIKVVPVKPFEPGMARAKPDEIISPQEQEAARQLFEALVMSKDANDGSG